MNERILEIDKEAGLKFPSETSLSPVEEKFAELIIRDVVNTVKRTQVVSPDFEWVILNNYELGIENE